MLTLSIVYTVFGLLRDLLDLAPGAGLNGGIYLIFFTNAFLVYIFYLNIFLSSAKINMFQIALIFNSKTVKFLQTLSNKRIYRAKSMP